ncbi:MAG: carbon-nitrogen hydrolase family protein [Gammaproteobacteria bacterium]|nr:carbon-nitrogen hydrolase family protein [Gammaproteobacteria bacterium]
MLSQYKVAVVQAAPVFLDLDATLEKGIALIEEAAGNGARLIGFPETWVPGYPWWIWLESPIGGLRFVQRYHENSVQQDSPQLQKLCDVARDNDIFVVMGASERAGGSLYISQFFIDTGGSVLDVRRKLKPTHVERTVFGDGHGNNLKVYETELGRVGGLCCWEHLQPLSKYALYAQNEQVHIGAWPTFSLYRGKAYSLGPELNMAASSVYAAEGQCYFLAPCGVISDDMVEMMADNSTKHELLPPGGGHAMIFGPDGAPMCDYLEDDAQGLLYADIDLGAISIAKSFADPAGHYSRPDVTRLLLNTSPVAPVEYLDAPPDREDGMEDPEHGADAGAMAGLTIVK